MLPVDRLNDFIVKNSLFEKEDKVLLAVSGGRDSVLMVHLFKKAGYHFAIAHCNFMLRGHDAEADEEFTRRLADQLQVSFHSVRFDTLAYAEQEGISIQMAARELRYRWFEQTRIQHGYEVVATAHHQNDAVETILLNLVRGTGISGLHGILPKRERIIRPLLFLTRDEIDSISNAERLAFRDDNSNFSTKYARNKIRLEVIPKLKELNPNLERTFETNSRRFLEMELLLKQKVDETRANILEKRDTSHYIALDVLQSLRPLHTLLFEILKPFSFSEVVTAEIVNSLQRQPGTRFESSTHLLIIDRKHLIISRKREAEFVPSIIIDNATSVTTWNDFYIKLTESGREEIEFNKHPSSAFVDADLLKFPIKVRSWKRGDSFQPLGLSGRKKLSDFFVNHKVPLSQKSRIPIFENGDGRIIWVGGMRIDDRFKVTANTKKVYIFELK